jgi:hypothetical protein
MKDKRPFTILLRLTAFQRYRRRNNSIPFVTSSCDMGKYMSQLIRGLILTEQAALYCYVKRWMFRVTTGVRCSPTSRGFPRTAVPLFLALVFDT